MKYIFLTLTQLYKKILSPALHYFSPGLGCRFYPTCSKYTHQAIKKFGIIKGIWMGLKRIIRCNPFNKGGYDPI